MCTTSVYVQIGFFFNHGYPDQLMHISTNSLRP